MAELQVDAVITGTGLTAAVVAACLSHDGHKVLMIDRHVIYGQAMRTSTVKHLLEMPESRCLNRVDRLREQFEAMRAKIASEMAESARSEHVDGDQNAPGVSDDQHRQPISQKGSQADMRRLHVERLQETLNTMYANKESHPRVLFELAPFAQQGLNELEALDHLYSESNKYALDMWPKLMFARSAVVDLLLNSGAHNYIHFTDTKGPMLYGYEPAEEGGRITLHEIPNSRNAICRSQLLSPMEKRVLMQMLTNLAADHYLPQFSSMSLKASASKEESKSTLDTLTVDQPDSNWLQFLRDQGCTQNMIDMFSHGICLGGEDVVAWTKQDGIRRLLKYIQSIGVYGQSEAPFLYPMYGTGDVVQAFARVSAVLGATIMLGTGVASLEADAHNKLSAVTLTNGFKVRTKVLLIGDEVTAGDAAHFAPTAPGDSARSSRQARRLHVVTLILQQPLLAGLNMAVVLPRPAEADGGPQCRDPMYLLQTGFDADAAPANKYIIYLMTVDYHPPAEFNSFAECSHPTVSRLLRCCSAMASQSGFGLEATAMATYTSHELASDNGAAHYNVELHRGWLAEGCATERQAGNGIVVLPKPMGTPAVPLLEEIPAAVKVCDALVGRGERQLAPYDDAGLVGCLEVKRPEEPEDTHVESAAEKLQSIIDKYG
ncbi:RAB GDP dissociation inhibitor, putative [Babesia bigemina]|uniref:RAB GDP dissociation inhibitor, putative n=1 Tax=Babesia bigemina TaxID=5866 RepID=A0A061D7L7_BABBI|nr:RAB GDP dissociation inhibitor, putative [Babesia bigemina]CDR96538.1 RAB GDP dissociation inhibitor, putative [Babesia bigemina]|eukprot:XP_012768724.1 RAB GDP dissociation inhibitor, putative [Babesia bigemina]